MTEPQEATPVEALAAQYEAVSERCAADAKRSEHANAMRARAATLLNCAADLREELAPAWDALARERDRLARIVENDGVELNRIIAATGEFSDANSLAHDVERMARAALKFGEARDDH